MLEWCRGNRAAASVLLDMPSKRLDNLIQTWDALAPFRRSRIGRPCSARLPFRVRKISDDAFRAAAGGVRYAVLVLQALKPEERAEVAKWLSTQHE